MSIFDFRAHLARQAEFSARVFGPGTRSKGIVDHIRKELVEVEQAPGDISEWIDVVILALDGAWRAGYSPDQIIAALVAKHEKNEARTWPDWRNAPQDKAIEHDRSGEVNRRAIELDPPCGIGPALELDEAAAVNASDMIHDMTRDLIFAAREAGQVVTIQTWPKVPLAMGNYEMVYSVREARS